MTRKKYARSKNVRKDKPAKTCIHIITQIAGSLLKMEKYNYYDAVKDDLKQMIEDNAEYYGWDELIKDGCLSDAQESIYDHAFIDDAVTGNASGSYTFSTYDAEENLCHNMDLLKEACEEFGCTPDLENPESCDVTIRCYVLSQVLSDVIEDLEDEVNYD